MHIPLFSETSLYDSHATGWSGKPKPLGLNTRHYLSLLFIAIFGTYYFVIVYGDFILLDDMNLINRLLNERSFVLKDIFFPHSVVNYYRPMVELSYRLDHFLWFDSASFWHLTNVMLHAANVGLVYLIVLLLLAGHPIDKEAAAFCSALLYAINPLATEPVCWVSGRSDLILALFMLSSFSIYLLFKRNRSYLYLLLSGLLYFCATLTKETALSMPLLLFVLGFFSWRQLLGEERKKTVIAAGYFILLTAAYFLIFRRASFDTSLMHVGIGTSGLRTVSSFENVEVLFASLGFYVKKMFIPWPLNFAISSIPMIFYFLLALMVLIFFAVRGRSLRPVFLFFVAWILITISPAIAAAVLNVAWVPWAERYLYVPLAGFSMALGFWFTLLFKTRHKFTAAFTFAVVIGLFWATTLYRTYLWADEVRLWKDTAQKSDYGPVYFFYGKSLLNRNRESDGVAQMKKAIVKGFSYNPYLVLSDVAYRNNDFEESEGWLKKAIRDYPEKADIHKYLAERYFARMSGKGENRAFFVKAIDEYIKYVTVRKDDAAACLRIAQLYRSAHEGQRAVPFLEQVIKIDSGSPHARTAMKYLQETQKGKNVQ